MSCWVCTDRHISMLAAYAVQNQIFRVEVYMPGQSNLTDADILALKLHAANLRSYAERYPNESDETTPFKFDDRASRLARELAPVAIIKSAQCFNHQASDARSWEGSLEQKIIQSVINHAIGQLPGYEAAPWGI